MSSSAPSREAPVVNLVPIPLHTMGCSDTLPRCSMTEGCLELSHWLGARAAQHHAKGNLTRVPWIFPCHRALHPQGLPTGDISGGHESAFHSLLKILILPLVFMPFKSGNEFYNFSSGAQLVARVVKLNFINISCWDQGKSIKKAERKREKERQKGKKLRKEKKSNSAGLLRAQLNDGHGPESAEDGMHLGQALPPSLPLPSAARLPGQMLLPG